MNILIKSSSYLALALITSFSFANTTAYYPPQTITCKNSICTTDEDHAEFLNYFSTSGWSDGIYTFKLGTAAADGIYPGTKTNHPQYDYTYKNITASAFTYYPSFISAQPLDSDWKYSKDSQAYVCGQQMTATSTNNMQQNTINCPYINIPFAMQLTSTTQNLNQQPVNSSTIPTHVVQTRYISMYNETGITFSIEPSIASPQTPVSIRTQTLLPNNQNAGIIAAMTSGSSLFYKNSFAGSFIIRPIKDASGKAISMRSPAAALMLTDSSGLAELGIDNCKIKIAGKSYYLAASLEPSLDYTIQVLDKPSLLCGD